MDIHHEPGDSSLSELVATFQDLARLSHQDVSTTTEHSPPVATALLGRLLLLCQAARGAIFLVSSFTDSEPLLPSASLHGTTPRCLALSGTNEEEVQVLLTTFSPESFLTSPPSHNPCWLCWRLPLPFSFPSQHDGNGKYHERSDPAHPLYAFLLFGWDRQDEEDRVIAMRDACVALSAVADAVATVIVQVLSRESLNELAVRADRKALREMEVMKAELLATVSHELRSPLTSIKGYAATLLRHEHRISHEERHEFLLAIHAASDRLADVIDSLLEMSELETGTIELERTAINVTHLVREAVMVAEQHLEGPDALSAIVPTQQRPTFAVHLEDRSGGTTQDELLIEADAGRLREVLDHLLKNAIMHAPEGGRIDVTVRPVLSSDDLKLFPWSSQETTMKITRMQQRVKQVVVIGIHDAGVGIAARHLARIFEPFYRVDTRLTRETSGLGLGLAICRRILELHDGLLWAESEAEQGSTFYICLPQNGGQRTERHV